MSCEQAAFEIHVGDREPVFEVDATTCDGAFDFTGWTGLTFIMTGPKEVTGAATAADGVLSYAWAPGDTDTPGFYEARFRGISPAGKQRTFPTKGAILIEVTE